MGLGPDAELRDVLVAESEEPLAGTAMGVWKEVAEERKGVAGPCHTSQRRSQGGENERQGYGIRSRLNPEGIDNMNGVRTERKGSYR